MADTLIRQGALLGKSREEVIAILGEPIFINHYGRGEFGYKLGPERSFISIDYEYLLIEFDAAGLANHVYIHNS